LHLFAVRSKAAELAAPPPPPPMDDPPPPPMSTTIVSTTTTEGKKVGDGGGKAKGSGMSLQQQLASRRALVDAPAKITPIYVPTPEFRTSTLVCIHISTTSQTSASTNKGIDG
jgi:hypothetical protein